MNNILFVGDIMPGGEFHYMGNPFSDNLLSFVYDHKIRVGTLEAAMGNFYEFDETKVKGRNNLIYAKDEDMKILKYLGMDVVSLANNHVYDLGERGLNNTITRCRKIGIETCGAGKNLQEASEPALKVIDGEYYAFLAYCCCNNESMGYVKYATENSPGVAPLIIEKVVEDIKEYSKKFEHVIILPHWGEEYDYLPSVEDVKFAKMMIDAGADGVFGSHTHRIAPMIKYKGKPIYFGLGNFAFPDYYMKPPRPMYYPTIFQIPTIKREFGYPYPIQEPQVQVWEGMSRVGMIVSYSGKEKTSYRFTSIDQENKVGFFRKWSVPLKRLRMKVMGICIKSNRYEKIFDIYHKKLKVTRRMIHRIVDKLGINFDENIQL